MVGLIKVGFPEEDRISQESDDSILLFRELESRNGLSLLGRTLRWCGKDKIRLMAESKVKDVGC